MYYSATALQELAREAFRTGEKVKLASFSANPGDGHALSALAPGLLFCLKSRGALRLHFHSHAWSGQVRVSAGASNIVVDLLSPEPGSRWVDVPASENGAGDVVVTLPSGSHPDALGSQAWLRGIAFDRVQDWQPSVLPITRTTDVALGKIGTFLVPHHDAVIGNSIKNLGVWAEDDLEFFARHINEGDTILDIGANIGHHTVYFSKAVGRTGQVISFEPQLAIFRYASANAVVNGCDNVTILQGCLGDAEGQVRMPPVSYDEQTNFGALGVSIRDDERGELVPTWTLDALLERGTLQVAKIDFVKIDVQSFELFVLRGAHKTLQTYKPRIFLEISPYWMKERGYDYTEVYDLLREIGYRFSHFHEGAGLIDGVRQWSGTKSEEWDVFCEPM